MARRKTSGLNYRRALMGSMNPDGYKAISTFKPTNPDFDFDVSDFSEITEKNINKVVEAKRVVFWDYFRENVGAGVFRKEEIPMDEFMDLSPGGKLSAIAGSLAGFVVDLQAMAAAEAATLGLIPALETMAPLKMIQGKKMADMTKALMKHWGNKGGWEAQKWLLRSGVLKAQTQGGKIVRATQLDKVFKGGKKGIQIVDDVLDSGQRAMSVARPSRLSAKEFGKDVALYLTPGSLVKYASLGVAMTKRDALADMIHAGRWGIRDNEGNFVKRAGELDAKDYLETGAFGLHNMIPGEVRDALKTPLWRGFSGAMFASGGHTLTKSILRPHFLGLKGWMGVGSQGVRKMVGESAFFAALEASGGRTPEERLSRGLTGAALGGMMALTGLRSSNITNLFSKEARLTDFFREKVWEKDGPAELSWGLRKDRYVKLNNKGEVESVYSGKRGTEDYQDTEGRNAIERLKVKLKKKGLQNMTKEETEMLSIFEAMEGNKDMKRLVEMPDGTKREYVFNVKTPIRMSSAKRKAFQENFSIMENRKGWWEITQKAAEEGQFKADHPAVAMFESLTENAEDGKISFAAVKEILIEHFPEFENENSVNHFLSIFATRAGMKNKNFTKKDISSIQEFLLGQMDGRKKKELNLEGVRIHLENSTEYGNTLVITGNKADKVLRGRKLKRVTKVGKKEVPKEKELYMATINGKKYVIEFRDKLTDKEKDTHRMYEIDFDNRNTTEIFDILRNSLLPEELMLNNRISVRDLNHIILSDNFTKALQEVRGEIQGTPERKAQESAKKKQKEADTEGTPVTGETKSERVKKAEDLEIDTLENIRTLGDVNNAIAKERQKVENITKGKELKDLNEQREKILKEDPLAFEATGSGSRAERLKSIDEKIKKLGEQNQESLNKLRILAEEKKRLEEVETREKERVDAPIEKPKAEPKPKAELKEPKPKTEPVEETLGVSMKELMERDRKPTKAEVLSTPERIKEIEEKKAEIKEAEKDIADLEGIDRTLQKEAQKKLEVLEKELDKLYEGQYKETKMVAPSWQIKKNRNAKVEEEMRKIGYKGRSSITATVKGAKKGYEKVTVYEMSEEPKDFDKKTKAMLKKEGYPTTLKGLLKKYPGFSLLLGKDAPLQRIRNKYFEEWSPGTTNPWWVFKFQIPERLGGAWSSERVRKLWEGEIKLPEGTKEVTKWIKPLVGKKKKATKKAQPKKTQPKKTEAPTPEQKKETVQPERPKYDVEDANTNWKGGTPIEQQTKGVFRGLVTDAVMKPLLRQERKHLLNGFKHMVRLIDNPVKETEIKSQNQQNQIIWRFENELKVGKVTSKGGTKIKETQTYRVRKTDDGTYQYSNMYGTWEMKMTPTGKPMKVTFALENPFDSRIQKKDWSAIKRDMLSPKRPVSVAMARDAIKNKNLKRTDVTNPIAKEVIKIMTDRLSTNNLRQGLVGVGARDSIQLTKERLANLTRVAKRLSKVQILDGQTHVTEVYRLPVLIADIISDTMTWNWHKHATSRIYKDGVLRYRTKRGGKTPGEIFDSILNEYSFPMEFNPKTRKKFGTFIENEYMSGGDKIPDIYGGVNWINSEGKKSIYMYGMNSAKYQHELMEADIMDTYMKGTVDPKKYPVQAAEWKIIEDSYSNLKGVKGMFKDNVPTENFAHQIATDWNKYIFAKMYGKGSVEFRNKLPRDVLRMFERAADGYVNIMRKNFESGWDNASQLRARATQMRQEHLSRPRVVQYFWRAKRLQMEGRIEEAHQIFHKLRRVPAARNKNVYIAGDATRGPPDFSRPIETLNRLTPESVMGFIEKTPAMKYGLNIDNKGKLIDNPNGLRQEPGGPSWRGDQSRWVDISARDYKSHPHYRMLVASFKMGQSMKNWYGDIRKTLVNKIMKDESGLVTPEIRKEKANLLLDLVSVTSPQAGPTDNLMRAISLYNWIITNPGIDRLPTKKEGLLYKQEMWKAPASDYLKSGLVKGTKVAEFLLDNRGNLDSMTIDTHMNQRFGGRDAPATISTGPAATEYRRKIIDILNKVAEDMGVTPAEAHASIWTSNLLWKEPYRAGKNVSFEQSLNQPYTFNASQKYIFRNVGFGKGVSKKMTPLQLLDRVMLRETRKYGPAGLTGVLRQIKDRPIKTLKVYGKLNEAMTVENTKVWNKIPSNRTGKAFIKRILSRMVSIEDPAIDWSEAVQLETLRSGERKQMPLGVRWESRLDANNSYTNARFTEWRPEMLEGLQLGSFGNGVKLSKQFVQDWFNWTQNVLPENAGSPGHRPNAPKELIYGARGMFLGKGVYEKVLKREGQKIINEYTDKIIEQYGGEIQTGSPSYFKQVEFAPRDYYYEGVKGEVSPTIGAELIRAIVDRPLVEPFKEKIPSKYLKVLRGETDLISVEGGGQVNIKTQQLSRFIDWVKGQPELQRPEIIHLLDKYYATRKFEMISQRNNKKKKNPTEDVTMSELLREFKDNPRNIQDIADQVLMEKLVVNARRAVPFINRFAKGDIKERGFQEKEVSKFGDFFYEGKDRYDKDLHRREFPAFKVLLSMLTPDVTGTKRDWNYIFQRTSMPKHSTETSLRISQLNNALRKRGVIDATEGQIKVKDLPTFWFTRVAKLGWNENNRYLEPKRGVSYDPVEGMATIRMPNEARAVDITDHFLSFYRHLSSAERKSMERSDPSGYNSFITMESNIRRVLDQDYRRGAEVYGITNTLGEGTVTYAKNQIQNMYRNLTGVVLPSESFDIVSKRDPLSGELGWRVLLKDKRIWGCSSTCSYIPKPLRRRFNEGIEQLKDSRVDWISRVAREQFAGNTENARGRIFDMAYDHLAEVKTAEVHGSLAGQRMESKFMVNGKYSPVLNEMAVAQREYSNNKTELNTKVKKALMDKAMKPIEEGGEGWSRDAFNSQWEVSKTLANERHPNFAFGYMEDAKGMFEQRMRTKGVPEHVIKEWKGKLTSEGEGPENIGMGESYVNHLWKTDGTIEGGTQRNIIVRVIEAKLRKEQVKSLDEKKKLDEKIDENLNLLMSFVKGDSSQRRAIRDRVQKMKFGEKSPNEAKQRYLRNTDFEIRRAFEDIKEIVGEKNPLRVDFLSDVSERAKAYWDHTGSSVQNIILYHQMKNSNVPRKRGSTSTKKEDYVPLMLVEKDFSKQAKEQLIRNMVKEEVLDREGRFENQTLETLVASMKGEYVELKLNHFGAGTGRVWVKSDMAPLMKRLFTTPDYMNSSAYRNIIKLHSAVKRVIMYNPLIHGINLQVNAMAVSALDRWDFKGGTIEELKQTFREHGPKYGWSKEQIEAIEKVRWRDVSAFFLMKQNFENGFKRSRLGNKNHSATLDLKSPIYQFMIDNGFPLGISREIAKTSIWDLVPTNGFTGGIKKIFGGIERLSDDFLFHNLSPATEAYIFYTTYRRLSSKMKNKGLKPEELSKLAARGAERVTTTLSGKVSKMDMNEHYEAIANAMLFANHWTVSNVRTAMGAYGFGSQYENMGVGGKALQQEYTNAIARWMGYSWMMGNILNKAVTGNMTYDNEEGKKDRIAVAKEIYKGQPRYIYVDFNRFLNDTWFYIKPTGIRGAMLGYLMGRNPVEKALYGYAGYKAGDLLGREGVALANKYAGLPKNESFLPEGKHLLNKLNPVPKAFIQTVANVDFFYKEEISKEDDTPTQQMMDWMSFMTTELLPFNRDPFKPEEVRAWSEGTNAEKMWKAGGFFVSHGKTVKQFMYQFQLLDLDFDMKKRQIATDNRRWKTPALKRKAIEKELKKYLAKKRVLTEQYKEFMEKGRAT